MEGEAFLIVIIKDGKYYAYKKKVGVVESLCRELRDESMMMGSGRREWQQGEKQQKKMEM